MICLNYAILKTSSFSVGGGRGGGEWGRVIGNKGQGITGFICFYLRKHLNAQC